MQEQVLKLFYDGDCPLCRREIEWIRKRTSPDSVLYIDIAAKDFCAERYGYSQAELMAEIRALLGDSQRLVGMQVFRELYRRAGLGWLASAMAMPGIRQVSEAAYKVFAKNRLRLTGRCHDKACNTDRE